MKSTTHSLKTVGMLATALTLALFANVAYGQWTNPPASPPNNNVEAPINVSNTAQTKPGMLTTAISRATDHMSSDWYCDYNGVGADLTPGTGDDACVNQGALSGGSGSSVPVPPNCTGSNALQWDGSSWSCVAMSGGSGVPTPPGCGGRNALQWAGGAWRCQPSATFAPEGTMCGLSWVHPLAAHWRCQGVDPRFGCPSGYRQSAVDVDAGSGFAFSCMRR